MIQEPKTNIQKPPPLRIPALTLWQPWASLIADGLKTVENRGWSIADKVRIMSGGEFAFGSRIAIHAGRTDDTDSFHTVFNHLSVPDRYLSPERLPHGVILAIATLAGEMRIRHGITCTSPEGFHATNEDRRWWDFGQVGTILRDVVRLPKPIPIRGAQGLWWWDVPEELGKMVNGELRIENGNTTRRNP